MGESFAEHVAGSVVRDRADERRFWHVFTNAKRSGDKVLLTRESKGETATVRLKKNNPRPVMVTIHLGARQQMQKQKNKRRKR